MPLDYVTWLGIHLRNGGEYISAKEYAASINSSVEVVMSKPSIGVGDTISKITKSLHIPECGGCKKRRDWLNEHFPYRTDNINE